MNHSNTSRSCATSAATSVRLLIGCVLLTTLVLPCSVMAQPKKQAPPKAAPAKDAGKAIGANVATPVKNISTLPDFKVELLYSVPGGEQGSWVALCKDPKGRIYASDQYGDLYRFNAPAAGQPLRAADVVKVPVNIRAINGMTWAFGALYVGVNDYAKKMQSGLYKISDSDNDDVLDKVELLRALNSSGDHGTHKILPTPDGKALYIITGNNTVLPDGPYKGAAESSPVPKIWGDDHLLPRMPDGRGHNRHVMAPGGIVYRVSPDGKDIEIFASGFRNIYGAKFPAKYQDAYYVLDWSWGKIYAVHLTPKGASYTATKEEFVTGGPLPVTDAVIGDDGAMYFAIGGRRVQSGLYRVTYTGKESTAASNRKSEVTAETKLRRSLEAWHGKKDSQAIAIAWPHLSHEDRFIRWAARTVIEHQPRAQWEEKALSTGNLEALLALARVGGVCPTHRQPGHVVDTALRDKLIAALVKIDFAKLSEENKGVHVRIMQIVLNRLGDPDSATIEKIIALYDPAYPAAAFELNWLLTETLAHLQAPTAAAKGMALIAAAESQEPQMEYARSLRFLKAGWTPELRKQQLEWFLKAANYKGGSSFDKFIEFIRNDSLATFTDAEKKHHATLIAQKPERKSAIEVAGAMFEGRTPTMWTLEELSKAAQSGMKGRDFENGRKMFGAAACFTCHRFGNAGGMTGPDLTGAGGRYNVHDLLDQIINPSKEINEQFAPVVVTQNDEDADVLTGVIVNLNGDTVTINTDLTDPNQRVSIDRKKVKSIEPSKVSPMPTNLLIMLKKDEILDLLAYTLSGGDKNHAMFKH